MNINDATELAYKNCYEAGTKSLTKWIDVKDKLPEYDGWYLAYIDFEGGRHKRIDVVHFDRNDMYFNYVWSHNVLCWMPLPDPPKERRDA